MQRRSNSWDLFVEYWLGKGLLGLTRREVDRSFLKTLTRDEKIEVKEIVRRNLPLRQVHWIEVAADLQDAEAIPILKELYAEQTDLSWRLTIAGSLWRLCRDEAFVMCLEEMAASDNSILKEAHMHQVIWLRDERAINLLLRLLDDVDSSVQGSALSILNNIHEFPQPVRLGDGFKHTIEEYKWLQPHPEFRAMMAGKLPTYLARQTSDGLHL
jgi:hypothetical protein